MSTSSMSLRDARFALDGTPGPWSVKDSLKRGVTIGPTTATESPQILGPQFAGPISLRALCTHYSAAGVELRPLEHSAITVWNEVMHSQILLPQLRERIRDPAILVQRPTGLCGPFAVVFELARRNPSVLVRAARELRETGRWTTPSGRVIEASADLRSQPIPTADGGGIEPVDWLIAATMRDDENLWMDIDREANGLDTMTFWDEMKGWTRDILGLKARIRMCWTSDEAPALRKAQSAVRAGGVAFLLINANLIKDGEDDSEEVASFRRWQHVALSHTRPPTDWKHSKDDNEPNHWVVYLGGLPDDAQLDDNDIISLHLWSWGREYEVKGTVDGIGEYLYSVVTGVPE